MLFKLLDTLFCLEHFSLLLKVKGLCNDSDCQNIHFLCDLRNNGSCACACAAAHTCCYEYHIRAVKSCLDLVSVLLCAACAHLRLCTCALAVCELNAYLYLCGSL